MPQTRLFLVGADSIIRLDLRLLVQAWGYRVVGEAADAPRAILLVPELRPDLVIMDIPVAGAPEGIEAAVTLTAVPRAPVLLLIGPEDPELQRWATEAHAVGYLRKPFEEEQLRPTIARTLARFPAGAARGARGVGGPTGTPHGVRASRGAGTPDHAVRPRNLDKALPGML